MESHETAEHFHIALTIQAAKPVKADSLGKKSIKSKKKRAERLFFILFPFCSFVHKQQSKVSFEVI